jgi:hypothetical protein
VVYRYFLLDPARPIELFVEGLRVRPVHPLFLEPEAMHYEPPIGDDEAPTGGGARKVGDWFIPVGYWEDPDTGERQLERVVKESESGEDGRRLIAAGTIHVRMARFPYGFVRGERGDRGTDAYRRYEIRKARRGMSFVRANRELETVDNFPKSSEDEAHGLGHWPLLQSYAYHWGIEVRFNPNLDDVFGITNDKQSVRPEEDFWRVLAQEQIDAAAMRENGWQEKIRKRLRDEREDEKARIRDVVTPSPAEAASKDADVASSDRPGVPEHAKEDAQESLEKAVAERAAATGRSLAEVREGIRKAAGNRKYQIEYNNRPDGPFYEPTWVGEIINVQINQAHPFYEVLYRDLMRLPGGFRAKEAVDILLITLARAELTANDPYVAEWYRVQRKRRWSPFLEDALTSLAHRLEGAMDEEFSQI